MCGAQPLLSHSVAQQVIQLENKCRPKRVSLPVSQRTQPSSQCRHVDPDGVPQQDTCTPEQDVLCQSKCPEPVAQTEHCSPQVAPQTCEVPQRKAH
eukprot:2486031-Amphidinium_carterae.1